MRAHGKRDICSLIVFIISLLLPGLALTQPGSALEAESQAQYFIAHFQDKSKIVPKNIYGELEFSGLSDPMLYDIVEQRFLEESKLKGSAEVDHAAWLAKALGYSGQEKYLATLHTALESTKNKKLAKYIEKSIERLPMFTAWNAYISQSTAGLNGKALYRQRTINMINSADSHLMMLGARRVWFHHPTDAEFVEIASKKLAAVYNRPNLTVRDVDGIGWLCNVLGKSENPEYVPLLNQIAEEADERRVRNYAKKNVRLLE